MRSAYHFTSAWLVDAPVARVAEVLTDLEHYPRWWPQVRAVASLGDDDARVLCRSRLPYTLDLVLHAESREPPLLSVAVSGDLDGTVEWRLTEQSDGTRLDFAQSVSVGGLLAVLSRGARPLLRWNHHQMMEGCRVGLGSRLGAQVRVVRPSAAQ